MVGGRGRWAGCWLVLLGPGAVAADPPSTVSVVELRGQIWGAGGFELGGDPVAAFLDPRGRACVLDSEGVSCFDGDGEEVWGLDEVGLHDVLVSDGQVLLTGLDRVLAVKVGRGGRVSVSETAVFDPFVVGDSDQAWLVSGAEVQEIGQSTEPWIVDGPRIVDILRATNGELGLIDMNGGLRWRAEDGSTTEPVPLAVALPQRALRTPVGWAILGEDGVELLDEAGAYVALIDADYTDAAVAQGELWLASELGVEAVDLATGEFDEDLVFEGAVEVLTASPGGDRLAVVLRGDRRLRVMDGDESLGSPSHIGAIRRVTPHGGGVVSVDEAGGVLAWDAAGEPRQITEEAAKDAMYDAAGGLWLALGDALVRPGSSDEVPIAATRVVATAGGVLVGHGSQVSLVAGSGEVEWTVEAPHTKALTVQAGVALAVDRTVSLIDLKSGERRRRMGDADREISDAAVAVGGLVFVGTDRSVGEVLGWRPGVAAREQDPGRYGAELAISPNGRWRVELTGDALLVRSMASGRVLGQGARDGSRGVVVVDDQVVWVGRDDGRVERWPVGEAVVDAALPPFGAYAQLDDFVPAPVGPAPAWQGSVGPGVADLAVHPDGRVAVIGRNTVVITADGAREVVVFDPPLLGVRGLWDPEFGLVVVAADDRVLARSEARVVTRLASVPGAPAPSETEAWTKARDGHPGGVRSVLVVPELLTATGGEDETVVLWDAPAGRPQYVLEGHGGPVVDLAIDPEGRRLIAGGAAGAVVWDLATLTPLMRLAPDLDVVAVGLSGDADSAWVAARDGTVARFELPQLPALP